MAFVVGQLIAIVVEVPGSINITGFYAAVYLHHGRTKLMLNKGNGP